MAANRKIAGKPVNAAEKVKYSRDAIVSKTLLDIPTGSLTLFAFDRGQGLSEHTAPYDATVMILDGQAEISIDGKRNTVKAGELIIMPANVPHALDAEQRFKMLLIMIKSK